MRIWDLAREKSEGNEQPSGVTIQDQSSNISEPPSIFRSAAQLPTEKFQQIQGTPETFPGETERQMREFVGQYGRAFPKSALSTYGNILDFLNLQPKAQVTPGQQALFQEQEDILERMNAGEVPSLDELMTLTGDEEAGIRFANTEEIETLSKLLGQENLTPTTVGGRYGKRLGVLHGGSFAMAPFGGFSPGMDIGAALAGQVAEELGAPEYGQAGAEMGTYLLGGGVPNITRVTSKTKPVQDTLEALRGVGFGEDALAVAKGALEKHPVLTKIGKTTSKSEKAFEGFGKTVKESYDNIFASAFPGFEHGVESMKDVSNNLYGWLKRQPFTIKNPNAVKAQIENFIEKHLPYEHGLREGLENRMKSWVEKKGAFPKAKITSDDLVEIIQDINAYGNWNARSQKTRILGALKEDVKSIMAKEGLEGRRFLAGYNRANKAYELYSNAKRSTELLAPAFTEHGVDYKKLSNILQNQKNIKTLAQNMSPQSINLMRRIAATGEDVAKMQKKLVHSNMLPAIHATGALVHAIGSIDPATAATYAAKHAVGAGVKEVSQRLATRMLTDPDYQRLSLRALNAIKSNTPKAFPKIAADFERLVAEENFEE